MFIRLQGGTLHLRSNKLGAKATQHELVPTATQPVLPTRTAAQTVLYRPVSLMASGTKGGASSIDAAVAVGHGTKEKGEVWRQPIGRRDAVLALLRAVEELRLREVNTGSMQLVNSQLGPF